MGQEKPHTTCVGYGHLRGQVEYFVDMVERGKIRLRDTPMKARLRQSNRICRFAFAGAAALCAVMSPVLAFAQAETPTVSTDSIGDTYRLDTGDSLRITVFNEKDMSTSGVIDDQGNISIPLLGPVRVSGLPLRQAERVLTDRLRDGYLVRPQVNVEVINYRPFYITGEVNQSGGFPYVVGITVHSAVALSGGFTARADRKDIVVTRKNGAKRIRFKATLDTGVLPGDIIEVDKGVF